jgi:hypothetical protein
MSDEPTKLKTYSLLDNCKKKVKEYLPEIGDYYKPNKTLPRKYITNSGISKKPEWLQIEGCPCIITSVSEANQTVELNSFSAAPDRNFMIKLDDLRDNFIKCPLVDAYITNLNKYPKGKIHQSEFNKRYEVSKLKKNLEKCVNKSDNEIIKKILGDKFWQLFVSQGAPYIGIDKYNKYIDGEIKLNSLERFGCVFFNRNSRWAPPIDITYEEFKSSSSYPAPLGIRPKDFCLPSELIGTILELIKQIMAFNNIDSTCLKTIIQIENNKKHRCLWCGEVINAQDYCSTYGSKDNFIEICHRDPKQRFLKTNMYWGHGECNRRQGGYSEEDRIEDALRLLRNNFAYCEKFKDLNPFN